MSLHCSLVNDKGVAHTVHTHRAFFTSLNYFHSSCIPSYDIRKASTEIIYSYDPSEGKTSLAYGVTDMTH